MSSDQRHHLPYITNYQEYNSHASIKIKREHDAKELPASCSSATSAASAAPSTSFDGADQMSCVYKSQSPTSKTILITTNNYSQSRCSDGSLRGDTPSIKNNSSITIFTHNASGQSANGQPTSATSSSAGTKSSSVGINILINNHFNEAPPPSLPGAKVKLEPSEEKPLTPSNNMPELTSSQRTLIHFSPPPQLHKGDEVFVRLKDDRFHLGSVVQVTAIQCLVRFADATERWTDRADVSRFNAQDVAPTCIVCKSSQSPELIAKCVKCGRSYHPKCMDAGPDGVWFCRRGHRNVAGAKLDVTTETLGTADQRLMALVNEVKSSKQLPYQVSIF